MDDRLDLLAVEIAAIGDGFQRRGADRLLRRLGLASCERSEPTLSCVAIRLVLGACFHVVVDDARAAAAGRHRSAVGSGDVFGWVPPTPVSR